MVNTETVKGFRDFVGNEAEKRKRIQEILQRVFESYGFEPAETPIIEFKDFVKGDNSDDEAVSDIFKLTDRGKRELALRYEFTFQLKRLMKDKKLPYKRYQIGPVFRDEPISGNRVRQFVQCDVDIVNSRIKDDAEILAITKKVLEELGIKFTIYVNNRQLLNEILEKQGLNKNYFADIIREVDKMDKLSESEVLENLKKYNASEILKIFKKPEEYFERCEGYSEIKELKKYCKYYGVKVVFSPSLARGLSYYNKNVFEVKSDIKETITGGGSYMFNNVQCTGISFGLFRLTTLAKIPSNSNKLMILSIEQDKEAIKISEELRKELSNLSVINYSGKPSKALDYANSYGINYVLFVGSEEIKSGKYKIKDMKTGKEKLVGIMGIIKELHSK